MAELNMGAIVSYLRHFLVFSCGVAIGIAIGTTVGTTNANPASPNSAAPVASSQSSSAAAASNDVSDNCPEAPVCPCLYSDAILPAPEFSGELPAALESNFEGEVFLKWNQVNGAKKYEVHMESSDGKPLKIYKTSRTVIYIKDIPLPPGKFEADYSLRLVSINGKDQRGPKGVARSLHVKPQATVVAPQVQEIRVED